MIGKRPECNNVPLAEASPAPLLLPRVPAHKEPAGPRLGCSLVWAQGARSIHAEGQLREVPDVYPGPEIHQVRGLSCAIHALSEPPAPISSLSWFQLPKEPACVPISGRHCSPGSPSRASISSQGPESPQRRCGLAILQLPADAVACAPTAHPPPPALGLQVNETLVFLSHLFCFPAKF